MYISYNPQNSATNSGAIVITVRNAGLEETQAGTKIAGGNINNLRYADDTTLMSPKSRSPSRGTLRFSGTPSSEPFLPS